MTAEEKIAQRKEELEKEAERLDEAIATTQKTLGQLATRQAELRGAYQALCDLEAPNTTDTANTEESDSAGEAEAK